MSKKLLRLWIIGTCLLLMFYQPEPVSCGKKSLLLGIALGAALKSKSTDNFKLFHVWIPLKLVAEAWKSYGKHAAYQEHQAYGYNYPGTYGSYGGIGGGSFGIHGGGFFKRRRR